MDSFEILTEVSIGLAGFGAIAIALGQRGRSLEPADVYRMFALYMTSLGALFLSLLPAALSHTALQSRALWQIASGVMLAYTLLMAVLLNRRRKKYLPKELWFGPLLMGVVQTTTVANIALQAANASGLLFAPNIASYYFGVLWFLAFACVFFLRILFYRPASTAD